MHARLRARPKFPRARLRVVLVLLRNPKFPNKTPSGTAATAALLRSFLSNSRRKPSHGRLDRVSKILSSIKRTLRGQIFVGIASVAYVAALVAHVATLVACVTTLVACVAALVACVADLVAYVEALVA